METIGKVLSLTLLTIFGSAAATIYLVDSDIMSSLFGTPEVYTSDKTGPPEKYADKYRVPERKESIRESMNYTIVKEVAEDAGEYSSVKPIWGQSYEAGTDTAHNERSAPGSPPIANPSTR